MVRGPAGRLVNWNRRMPIIGDRKPKRHPRMEYSTKFLLKFLLVAAGIATSAAVSKPPTTFTPRATIIAMLRR